MLERSAEALRSTAQSYIDDRANGEGCFWSFDSEGNGTKKTGAELEAVIEAHHQIAGAQKAMPVTDQLALDIAKTVTELDALRTRIEQLREVYNNTGPRRPELGLVNF
jgi:hypothetical protein